MHPELMSLATLGIVVGGVVLLALLAAWGLYRHERNKREAMRRGNQIYEEWLRSAGTEREDTLR